MRVVIRATRTESVLSIQIARVLLDKLKATCGFAIRKVCGLKSCYRGSGWYRFYGTLQAEGRDLKQVLRQLNLNLFALKDKEEKDSRVDPVVMVTTGMLKVGLSRHLRRLSVRGGVVKDRAYQACEGLLFEFTKAFTPRVLVSESKLLQLKEKFG